MTNLKLILIKFHFIYHNIYIYFQSSCIYVLIADPSIMPYILLYMNCHFLKKQPKSGSGYHKNDFVSIVIYLISVIVGAPPSIL